MFANNKVILQGDVFPTAGSPYIFQGNTSTDQVVSTVVFTGQRTTKSMFHNTGLKIDEDSGRVYTEGAPTTQPSGTDGMPGGYHPVSNPYGGMKEIDHWCPRYMHAKAKAIDRNDPTELFKANTSGQHAIDQSMASPMVDEDDDITSFLLPKDTFHETVWFTMRAEKYHAHRRTNTYVEDEDFIDRVFYINVYHNALSDRNEIILDYVDPTNKTEGANTDTAFTDSEGNVQTNIEHLANGYSNGVFTNM